MSDEFIWRKLREKAYKISNQSGVELGVGAAGYSSKKALLLGCNFSRNTPKISVCAECSLISNLISNGGGFVSKIVIVNREDKLIEPCGRCNLIINDHINSESEIMLNQGIFKIYDIINK